MGNRERGEKRPRRGEEDFARGLFVAPGFLRFGLYEAPSFVRERTAPFFCNALFVPAALWLGRKLGV